MPHRHNETAPRIHDDWRLQAYADLKVGFVDCAVLAVTERLGEPKLATLDHRLTGMLLAAPQNSEPTLPAPPTGPYPACRGSRWQGRRGTR
jgi:hypothetical protein